MSHPDPNDAGRGTVVDRVEDALAAPVAALEPRLRGWLHAGVSPVVLAAGIVLICLAPTSQARWASVVYALAAFVLFATSGVYDVGTWRPRADGVLRRVDHANIYLIIARTFTPIAALTLVGGVLYTLGAVVYALERPDPNPTWFGFHEIFAFTIGAWACQYVAVSLLVHRA